jgi:hypothetical protein
MMRGVGFFPFNERHHVFRKFLLFTSLLLTFGSQNGYALSLESPNAVLQRGSYTKVTISFTLSNISPQDLSTYEMGSADTDSGIRSLTKYLNICVAAESGKKCDVGPSILKVRYLTNSEYDTTPQTELSNDYTASFPNGSPLFEIPANDITQTYRDLYVTIELTASAATPFTTDKTFILLRLLPGTSTNTSDFKDAEIKPKLAVAANDVIAFEVRPSKETLTAIWDKNAQIHRADDSMAPPDGAIAFVVPEDKWDTLNLPINTYNQTDPGAETKIDNACQIKPSNDTECEVECPNLPNGNYYMKAADVTAAGFPVITSGNTGNISITGLSNTTNYALVVQAQPDGLQRRCLIAKPSDAIMLSELGGGPAPKIKDPRCFIATAAYGSPLDPHLDTLRWFRDHVLMVTGFGRELVEIYYSLSPPLADFIATHPALRTATRGALWLPVLIIEFWRERPSLMLTLSAMAGTFLLLFLRRRSLRASF